MPVVTEIDGEMCVSVRVSLVRQCGMKRICVSDDVRMLDESALSENRIVQGVARARAWMKMLDDGAAGNLLELAKVIGIDRAIIAKYLRLATISPRIIQAVIDGSAPSGVSVTQLLSVQSDDWDEQEREIGLAAG